MKAMLHTTWPGHIAIAEAPPGILAFLKRDDGQLTTVCSVCSVVAERVC